MEFYMEINNNICPNCYSEEFISSPNQYDILVFEDGNFSILKSEFIDEVTIYCRGCGETIDYDASMKTGKIIIKDI